MGDHPSTEELERAGIPSRQTFLLKLAGLSALVLLFGGLGYLAIQKAEADAKRYANVVARLPFRSWDTPVTAPVRLKAGRQLLFVLRASSFTWSGRNNILLRSEGLRQGKVVATVDCSTRYFKDRAWANHGGAWSQHDECNLQLPAEGLDAVRLTLRRQNPGNRLDFEDLVVDVVAE